MKHSQENSQITGRLVLSSNMGGRRGTEEVLPNFLVCKGNGGKDALSDLQDSVKSNLTKNRFGSFAHTSCLVYHIRLTLAGNYLYTLPNLIILNCSWLTHSL